MKKIFVFLVAFCLLSSAVFAEQSGMGDGTGSPELVDAGQGEGGPVTAGAGQDTGQGNLTQKEARTMEGEGNMSRNKEMLQTGLENALSRVTNENARMRLEQNLEKFMQKYQERLEKKMQNVTIEDVDNETGAMTIKAKEQVKFLGFIKGTATKRFEMDDKGNINEKAPWYRFLYSEDKE
jgi:hypothetical protein